ncbi:rab11 family-interacting protein 1 isoform X2 [Nycticebus coucang]|uniref:rab11 family-interacting protein 1 isoform X2 n=1 Tax=Nycticebus coucang TaxID=9470 RepID=UPI00234DE927|nr:rab11 family-interacting protein 1 isoform X2 [Nycticebus coucang]
MSLAASAGRGSGAVWSPTHVQVTVMQARGLRSKGPAGTSDAYAVIQVGKEKYATSVSERSLGAPVWREEATFELPPLLSSGAVPADAATLQLTVLHRALLGLDKFLGRAEVDLRELHRDQGRRKTQWYTLKSKPGKKDKERGEIEVDIQFMRHNMTASMFDLSMKDKSRNPFGKLKDKIKGRHKDSPSDTVSAIVSATAPSGDSDDESSSKDKKKKSKIKGLFSKSNLQKTPLSQSMSVLPTSKSDKVLLRPGDFQSRWDDDDKDESSSTLDVMSHKRTASTDLKQLNQINFTLPKKEGLSFLGGLRSKNDVLSRSNICINGNHVYLEQLEAKSETKDSSPSSSPSPQGFRKKNLFSSTENLAVRSWKESGDGGETSSDRQLSSSSTHDSVKSMSLPSYRPLVSGDIKENTAPVNAEAAKEAKESKKQENKKTSLLSLVTGKKDGAKGREGEKPSANLGQEKEGTLADVSPRDGGPGPVEDCVRGSEKDTTAVVPGRGNSLNPFEDVQITEPEADPESKFEPKPPVPSSRAPQTRAVKPRVDVSPEAQPTARPLPHSDSPSPPLSPSGSGQAPIPSDSGQGSETQSSESPSVSSSFSSPIAAPISTSTPIQGWPSTDKGQAGSEEPSLLLKAELQKESLTSAPNAVSSALGSLFVQPHLPGFMGMEDSSTGRTCETGTESRSSDRSEGFLPEQPKVGRQEELLRSPAAEQDDTSGEAQGAAPALSLHGGRLAGSGVKPRSQASAENMAGDDGVTSSVTATATPLHMGELVPSVDSVVQKPEEMGLNIREGPKKVKKRVSFSEQLVMEEEVARSAGCVEEGEGRLRELIPVGTATGDMSEAEPTVASHTEDAERELAAAPGPVTQGAPAPTEGQPLRSSGGESFSKGPTREASSAGITPFLRVQGDDAFLAQCQSKASDHEGLLSDPLSDLQSASDVRSPIMADLNLSLPSIPEVASDDERVDQADDDRRTAQPATLDAGASSSSMSGRPEGSAPAERLGDFRLEAPRVSVTAPSQQTAALGVHKPHPDKIPSLEKQLLGPGSGEEEKPKGNGSVSQPPGMCLDPPLPSPSLSETSSATHSFPSSPHSDTHHTNTAESPKKATAEGSAGKVENFGKRKPLLQAWVSPSETHPVSAQPGAGLGSAKHRLHPVKPMNTTATKIGNSSFGTATIISENMINEAIMKKYNPSDPAFAYAQLTHDELIQLVLKQKETISKKEFQVRELEDYIDNLLVRVMEETPNILRIPAQL